LLVFINRHALAAAAPCKHIITITSLSSGYASSLLRDAAQGRFRQCAFTAEDEEGVAHLLAAAHLAQTPRAHPPAGQTNMVEQQM
jgi:hypothetical protein